MNRRRLLMLGAAVAVLASVGGTGGFSTANADRGVQVAVVDDEQAYLGIESENVTGETWNVTVTNRFPDGATAEVTVEVGDRTDSTTLGAGASERLTLTGVACGATANLTASAGDGSVAIEASREVTCSAAVAASTTNTTLTTTPSSTSTPDTSATPTPTGTPGAS